MTPTAVTTPYCEYRPAASVSAPYAASSGVPVVNRVRLLVGVEKWQRDALTQIAKLAQMPTNWDGYGSRPPADSVRDWAGDLVLRTKLGILPPPHFGPESDGAIEIDWHSGHGREIELHIAPGQPVEYLKVENGVTVREGEFSQRDDLAVDELLTWLRRG